MCFVKSETIEDVCEKFIILSVAQVEIPYKAKRNVWYPLK